MSDEAALIKERLDIAEVVGEYVTLKRTGGYFKGLCPFHQEKTSSFIVSPDKGMWHCFGACSEGGDVFSFIQKIEGIDFVAALKLLAPRAGVTLAARPAQRQAQGKREQLFELLEQTARFYQEILLNQSAGAQAREYLAGRGVQAETVREFRLGYAPMAWDALQLFLRRGGYGPREMIAAGVVGESAQHKIYDRFRGRVIFPITDRQGRVVAFGGRIAPWHETGQEGKYINSPETELYSKRNTVYNLARAKQHLRGNQPCVVVEGYMDVVLLDQIGVYHVVASSGTAFTAEHIAQLGRFTSTLHFAFDADRAGVKAAIAATASALAAGMRVATVLLPEGQDPADVARQDPEALTRLLAKPRSLIAVLLDRLRTTRDGHDKEEYVAALVPLIAGVANAVQQGEMIQEMAGLLALPEARIVQLLEQYRPAYAQAPNFAKASLGESADKPAGMSASTLDSAERYLLGLLYEHLAVRERLLSDVHEDLFNEAPARALYRALLQGAVPPELASYAEGVRQLSAQHVAQAGLDPFTEATALLVRLRRARLKNRLHDLQAELLRGNDKQRTDALHEFQTVVAELSRLRA